LVLFWKEKYYFENLVICIDLDEINGAAGMLASDDVTNDQ
jgi:hypothetical protein